MQKNLTALFILIFSSFFPFSTQAFQFDGGGYRGSFDTTVSLGAAWRLQDADPALIGRYDPNGTSYSANGDNGNKLYKKGFISQAIKVTHEFDVSYENIGIFIRTNYFYDHYNMNKEGLPKAAKDRIAKDFSLLDAFIASSFEVGDSMLDFRLGNQVVSWGESTFISNGINSINPVDVAKIRVPGAEIRDALKPVPMAWAALELSTNLTLEAFYQFTFEKTDIDPSGSYFSDNDYASPDGNRVIIGGGSAGDCKGANAILCIPRVQDRNAKDNGQFGFALRYFAEELNSTEIGLYFMNIHSRLPLINGISSTMTSAAALGIPQAVANSLGLPPGMPPTAGYFISYPEDIQVFGLSFSTSLGSSGIALQGEVSYKKGVPYQVDDFEILLNGLLFPQALTQLPVSGFGQDVLGYKRLDTTQWQFTLTKAIANPTLFGADQLVLLGEAGGTHVNLPAKDILRFNGPGTDLPGSALVAGALGYPVQDGGFADPFSWGYRVMGVLKYNNAFAGVNLTPRVVFNHDVSGTSPGPGGNFIEGRKAISLGLKGDFQNSWSADLSYINFFGADKFNTIRDRDYVSFNMKYSF